MSSSSGVQCHYDVLGIPRDADAITIKKAYRKLALKYHPDKNITSVSVSASSENDAFNNNNNNNHGGMSLEQLFLLVQQAYECLSDIAERKWYDDHRDAILKGWSVATGTTSSNTNTSSSNNANHNNSSSSSSNPNNDIVFNVAPYMYAGCYYGFDNDSNNSFYNVYQNVFQQIYQEEVNGCCSSKVNTGSDSVEYLAVPFGNSTSNYESIVMKFYQNWESYSSILTYAWADQWNVQEAEQRRIRRAMEEDNQRARRKARKIRNDEIAALVRFVKRRDPRIIIKKEELENLRLLREYESKELIKQKKMEKELANREWREQAEREALAMEEDDRINGRVRLADLDDDDYDYYGGGKNKKKRGKGKKGKSSKAVPEHNDKDNDDPDEDAIEQQHTQAVVDSEDPLTPISDMNQMNLTKESTIDESSSTIPQMNVEKTSEVANDSLDVPYSKWRCECCIEIFDNEVDMMKHFKSKKHKDIAALRKSTTTDDISNTSGTVPVVGGSKKIKRKSKQRQHGTFEIDDTDENEVTTESMFKNIASDQARTNDDSHTEEDNDDDDELDVSHTKNKNRNNVIDDFDDDDDDEPLYWRCECCQKDFQSEGQMENHMNSKKHKAMYRKYEKEVGKKLLYEVVEEITNTGTTNPDLT